MTTRPIAFSADWHARGSDLEAFDKQLGAMVNQTALAGCELHCCAGDIFDEPNIADSRASTGAIVEVITRHVANAPFRWLFIPGNHDVSGAGSVDALTCLDQFKNVQVVREPKIIFDSGRRIHCLPWNWSGSVTPYQSLLKLNRQQAFPDQNVTALLAHVQRIGSRMGSRKVCEGGSWAITDLEIAALRFGHIALGDFHHRHNGYVGALRQLNFGEEGNPAGFEIWHPDSGEVKWIELNEAPRYRTVKLYSKNEPIPEPRPNENLRVQTIGFVPSASEVMAREQSSLPGALRVDAILQREERAARAEVPEGAASDPVALVNLWASTQSPPIEAARVERMVKALKEIAV